MHIGLRPCCARFYAVRVERGRTEACKPPLGSAPTSMALVGGVVLDRSRVSCLLLTNPEPFHLLVVTNNVVLSERMPQRPGRGLPPSGNVTEFLDVVPKLRLVTTPENASIDPHRICNALWLCARSDQQCCTQLLGLGSNDIKVWKCSAGAQATQKAHGESKHTGPPGSTWCVFDHVGTGVVLVVAGAVSVPCERTVFVCRQTTRTADGALIGNVRILARPVADFFSSGPHQLA